MIQFEVRFYRSEDVASSSWLVTEVLSDDGEGNRTSDIRAEFDPTAILTFFISSGQFTTVTAQNRTPYICLSKP